MYQSTLHYIVLLLIKISAHFSLRSAVSLLKKKDTYPYHTLILVCLTAMVQKTTLKTFYVFMGSLNILSGCHRLVNEWEALKCICGGQC